MAAVVIMYVVLPSPSSETTSASAAVPSTTRAGSSPTTRTSAVTTGSNNPASIMIAKYRIANVSMMPVGAIFVTPASIMPPSDEANPPSTPKTIGTRMSAVSGAILRVMISVMKTMTIENARIVRITRASTPRFRRESPVGMPRRR